MKQEETLMDDQIKVNAEAVESLNRILSKYASSLCFVICLNYAIIRNLDQQLFNKANEIQEEISRKRLKSKRIFKL